VLLDGFSRRLAVPDERIDERLWRVWQEVDADLGKPWTNAAMARIACMSEEHLRRLCLRYYRQTPMERVFQLRMQRATGLLSMSPRKIEDIAYDVGFSSIFSFSSAYKRWCGHSPSERRKRLFGQTGGEVETRTREP
jgi:transcriptional regulator GlxA family with amidase domain